MNKKPYRPGPKRPSNASRPRGRNRQMGGKNDKDTNLINDEIRASEVRLVGDNVEQGIYPIEEALNSGTLSVDDLIEKSKRLPQLKDELDEKSMRWLELSEIE